MLLLVSIENAILGGRMATMTVKEEVMEEVDAVLAVYSDDCLVTREFPPCLTVRIRPRTADVSSQQFVEAVVGIYASAQYPQVPPFISIIDSKGLDAERQEHLVTSMTAKSEELSSCFMLVALCEEAVEILSNMNYPEGNCPLCLCPLFTEKEGIALPFMKLMSCFHCFHSACISRWWRWLQEQNVLKENIHVGLSSSFQRGVDVDMDQRQLGNCPVCRKLFDVKDIEHVNLVEANSCPLIPEDMDLEEEREFLQSDMEKSRRQKVEALIEVQKKNNGFIEPKKTIVIAPGMFLPDSQVTSTIPTDTRVELSVEIAPDLAAEPSPRVPSPKSTSCMHKNSNFRRNRAHHLRKERQSQPKQKWIQKEHGTSYH